MGRGKKKKPLASYLTLLTKFFLPFLYLLPPVCHLPSLLPPDCCSFPVSTATLSLRRISSIKSQQRTKLSNKGMMFLCLVELRNFIEWNLRSGAKGLERRWHQLLLQKTGASSQHSHWRLSATCKIAPGDSVLLSGLCWCLHTCVSIHIQTQRHINHDKKNFTTKNLLGILYVCLKVEPCQSQTFIFGGLISILALAPNFLINKKQNLLSQCSSSCHVCIGKPEFESQP